MKLAIVTHNVTRGDGQGRVILEIARHAAGRVSDLALIADQVEPTLGESNAEILRVAPLVLRPLLLKVWDFARQADPIVLRLRKRGYLVVGNGFTTRSSHDVNIAHMVHGAWLKVSSRLSAPMHPGRRVYQRLYTQANAVWEKQAFAAANCVVAVSNLVREHLEGIGVDPRRIRVINNGVDLSEFRTGPEDRGALGLPGGVPLAIFVGDLRSSLKNLSTILRALPTTPELHLAVVGGTDGSPFPAMAQALGVASRTHFLGKRNDVARVMRASDFCVFPSHCDAFGLVVLEAMACGLPVIVSSAAGASQLVTQECGLVLHPSDAPAWANALARFARLGPASSAMGAAGRQIAEHHSWSHMAEQYLALFTAMGTRP